jgi:lysosomal acid lipase/cholesteryl ester hydrolase
MGNNRGNKYSRRHTKFNPDKDTQFWDYSFHEMGLHDLPAIIDTIISLTGVGKITYIGHSQGTSQMFAGLTLKHDYYRAVLNGFIALGPVTSMGNIGSSFVKTATDWKLDKVIGFLKINEILADSESVGKLQRVVCKYVGILCKGVLKAVSDAELHDNDMDRLLVYVSHFPSGTSTKCLKHFSNNIRNNVFADISGNHYDLSLIKHFPIGLFVGENDKLATVEDNRKLKEILIKNNSLKFYKEYEDVGHITFFLSKKNLFMDDILDFLNNKIIK